jgi:hypothetical protein
VYASKNSPTPNERGEAQTDFIVCSLLSLSLSSTSLPHQIKLQAQGALRIVAIGRRPLVATGQWCVKEPV